MKAWAPLLDWWFGPQADTDLTDAQATASYKQGLWFGYRESQDADARERFGDLVEQALVGQLPEWDQSPRDWLAQILLLDQLPRMIHRGTPRAFFGDRLALAIAKSGIEQGLHLKLSLIEQVFVYLPFEHAEDLACQDEAVALFSRLRDSCQKADSEVFAGYLNYAERHREVIRRFGRFPHRNEILGRASSVEEKAFLQKPGSRF